MRTKDKLHYLQLAHIAPDQRTSKEIRELQKLARRMRWGFLGWKKLIWKVKMFFFPMPAIKALNEFKKEHQHY